MNNGLNFAVLVDGDNLPRTLANGIIGEVQDKGTVAIKRIYGDWTGPHMNKWKDSLSELGIRPIQQFRYAKEATDMAMVMDAMEIVLRQSRINAVCIVSSDNGFAHLAIRIREHGLHVLGIGSREKISHEYEQACNEFVYTENLDIQDVREEKRGTAEEPEDVTSLLKRASQRCSDVDGWVRLAELGIQIKVLAPAFDPRSYNRTNLLSLLEECDAFEVKRDDNWPPNYFARLRKKEPRKVQRLRGRVMSFYGNGLYGFIDADGGEYYFHLTNVTKRPPRYRIGEGCEVDFEVLKPPRPDAESNEERRGRAIDVHVIT